MRGDVTVAVLKQQVPGRPNAILILLCALATLAMSAAVCAAAILAPAPAAAVPVVVALCLGTPLFVAWELRSALAGLRAARVDRAGARALTRFRQSLEQLPETEHPLGL